LTVIADSDHPKDLLGLPLQHQECPFSDLRVQHEEMQPAQYKNAIRRSLLVMLNEHYFEMTGKPY
jgi:hypothetical protein